MLLEKSFNGTNPVTTRLHLLKKGRGAVCVHRVFISLFVLLVLLIENGTGALVEKPENTAVDVGQSVTLKCKTNLGVRLQWSSVDAQSKSITIYNGANVAKGAEEFQMITKESGQFDLHFNASEKQAMLFVCYEPRTEAREAAEVTVLESSPTCVGDGAYSPESITYNCSVSFTGNWAPQIGWYINGQAMPKSKKNDSNDGRLLTSTLTVPRVTDESNSDVVCQLNFSTDDYSGRKTAKNIPNYNRSVLCSVEYESSTTLAPTPTTTDKPDQDLEIILVVVFVSSGIAVVIIIVAVLCYKKKTDPCFCLIIKLRSYADSCKCCQRDIHSHQSTSEKKVLSSSDVGELKTVKEI